jgi:hypothetical protein
MDNIARVIRHAARQLWRAPLVSVASILTLAIGIGACTLMMSVVSTVLLKPLPYGDPDRLVMSWGWYPNANLGFPEQPTHGAVFSIMRDNTQAFESLAAFRGASFNFGDVISPERLDGSRRREISSLHSGSRRRSDTSLSARTRHQDPTTSRC